MNTTPPPLPVIVQNDFKVFAHPDGRFSAAVKVGNERLYARDYPAGALPEDDGMVEPDDYEFTLLLKQQETNQQTAVFRPQAAAGGKG